MDGPSPWRNLQIGMMPGDEFSRAVANGHPVRGASPEMTQVDGDSASV